MSQESPNGESRRDVMKKGAVAATALAVGTGATAGSATAQENDEGEVVISGRDYYPNVEFRVLSEVTTATRDEILEDYEDEFDDIGDWEAYAVRLELGTGEPIATVFVDEDEVELSPGDSAMMTETAAVRNAELNLLEVDVTAEEAPENDDNDIEPEDDDDENDEEDEEDDENDEVIS